jgi:hypothetical protein
MSNGQQDGSPDSQQRATPGQDAGGGARLLAGFVLVFGVLAALGGIVLPLSQLPASGSSVAVLVADPAELVPDDGDLAPDGASLDLAGIDGAMLVADELPVGLRVLSQLPWTLAGLLLLGGAWLLWRILLDIAAGRPFHPRTPGRLRGLALVVLAGSLFPSMIEGVASAAVVEHLGGLPDGSPLGVQLFEVGLPMPFLVILLLFIAAQVFDAGQRLEEDVEGLI